RCPNAALRRTATSWRSATVTHPVLIPADVDREDRIMAGLTARQVLILTLTAIVLYLAWAATRTLLPLPVFAVLAVPVAAVAALVVLGQRDGLSLDRLLVAAVHRTCWWRGRPARRPRHRCGYRLAPSPGRPASG
ncbi:PrgI family protein, partial [Parafrankia soli]|uniref:PrgI family protein n=1 Tax=Parafrankia soli TaxID=2599596 RepID=UPI003B588A58